jgi:hypothetical protein
MAESPIMHLSVCLIMLWSFRTTTRSASQHKTRWYMWLVLGMTGWGRRTKDREQWRRLLRKVRAQTGLLRHRRNGIYIYIYIYIWNSLVCSKVTLVQPAFKFNNIFCFSIYVIFSPSCTQIGIRIDENTSQTRVLVNQARRVHITNLVQNWALSISSYWRLNSFFQVNSARWSRIKFRIAQSDLIKVTPCV